MPSYNILLNVIWELSKFIFVYIFSWKFCFDEGNIYISFSINIDLEIEKKLSDFFVSFVS